METIATLAVGIIIATLSIVLNNKTRDKIDAVENKLCDKIYALDAKMDTVARELRDKIDAVDTKLSDKIDAVVNEVSNLAQRVTALEVIRTGSANIPPLPTKPSSKKVTKPKANTKSIHKMPQHRSARYAV